MTVRAIRQTKQKDAIREGLRRDTDFVSAHRLHQELEDSGHHIGLATVYRQLNALVDQGKVDTVRVGGQQLFRLCDGERHHHHLVCTSCGKTMEFDSPSEQWLLEIAAHNGFKIQAHTLEVFGLCEECQRKEKERNTPEVPKQ